MTPIAYCINHLGPRSVIVDGKDRDTRRLLVKYLIEQALTAEPDRHILYITDSSIGELPTSPNLHVYGQVGMSIAEAIARISSWTRRRPVSTVAIDLGVPITDDMVAWSVASGDVSTIVSTDDLQNITADYVFAVEGEENHVLKVVCKKHPRTECVDVTTMTFPFSYKAPVVLTLGKTQDYPELRRALIERLPERLFEADTLCVDTLAVLQDIRSTYFEDTRSEIGKVGFGITHPTWTLNVDYHDNGHTRVVYRKRGSKQEGHMTFGAPGVPKVWDTGYLQAADLQDVNVDDQELVELWEGTKEYVWRQGNRFDNSGSTVGLLQELLAQYTHPTPPAITNIQRLWALLPHTEMTVAIRGLLVERKWQEAIDRLKEPVIIGGLGGDAELDDVYTDHSV